VLTEPTIEKLRGLRLKAMAASYVEQQRQTASAHHDGRGLLRLRPGTHLQIHVGLGDAELLEEVSRHLRVVVLAGVDEPASERAPLGPPRLEHTDDWGDLDEVGPRPSDDVNQHAGALPLTRRPRWPLWSSYHPLT